MKAVKVKSHKRGKKSVKAHTRKVKTAADKPGAGKEMKNRKTNGPDSYAMNDNQGMNDTGDTPIINNELPDSGTRDGSLPGTKKKGKVARIKQMVKRVILGPTPNI
jgi:hypothetical protein